MGQQPETLDDDTGSPREAEEILEDHVEPLAPEPVERLEHGLGRSVHPALVHVHGDEPVKERAVFGCAPAA